MMKTWIEKRDCGKSPYVKILDKKFAGIPQGCKMLVSSPQEIDSLVRRIPEGDTISPAKIRETLAKKHKADATCPVSTGIFLRIVCEAALEEKRQGKTLKEITPFWQIDLEGTSTAEKLNISRDEMLSLRQQNQ
ncbi:MAG TPA: hypothetical protein TECP_01158 [Hyphomicrobiaceae bacterium MAG_BT-2024]